MQPVSIHKYQPNSSISGESSGIAAKKQNWYAIYTRPRHEKKIYARLKQENIEAFLPLQTTIRQWSDRKKKIQEPLFRCYIFINISNKDYYRVLNVNGVVRYVTFDGKAVAIPEKQIRLIRILLNEDIEIEETPDPMHKGARVEIKTGPLCGIAGELFENAGKKRVIIRIEEINKTLLINVPCNYLRLIG
jgi:transcription antitermination factor NusG